MLFVRQYRIAKSSRWPSMLYGKAKLLKVNITWYLALPGN